METSTISPSSKGKNNANTKERKRKQTPMSLRNMGVQTFHTFSFRLTQTIGAKSDSALSFVIVQVPIWDYNSIMRIIAVSTLKAYWSSSPAYSDVIEPGMAWYREALKADWATPNEVKAQFSSASILKDGRVVFNIAGNKYRLVVWINYPYRIVYIRFIGTHKQYDEIDAQTI